MEISRRISISIAAFTFTCIGTVFGIELARKRQKRKAIFSLLLGAMTMTFYAYGLTLTKKAHLAPYVFLLPHLIPLLASLLGLKKIAKGVFS
jgi:lipopolysaccharide export system permease protein